MSVFWWTFIISMVLLIAARFAIEVLARSRSSGPPVGGNWWLSLMWIVIFAAVISFVVSGIVGVFAA